MKPGGKLSRFREATSTIGSTASVSMQLTFVLLITRTKVMRPRMQKLLHAISNDSAYPFFFCFFFFSLSTILVNSLLHVATGLCLYRESSMCRLTDTESRTLMLEKQYTRALSLTNSKLNDKYGGIFLCYMHKAHFLHGIIHQLYLFFVFNV